MTGKDIVFILIAYLLGGICSGYYLVRCVDGTDVREQGSGGVGARNVGRLLGRPGFVFTLLGDGLKGVLAVMLARSFGIAAPAVSLALVAVIAGHVWPPQLQFRGGRGISTAIGAYLAYDPWLALLLLGIVAVLMGCRRGFILSGLAAFLVLPPVAYVLDFPGHTVAALAGASAIILFAHRERLRQVFGEAQAQREA
ncbi:MAG: glycerol-3-phosphate acyltransferase [Kiritimatiellales bacterium]|nr:glycerol-3-phosphate acyltransferase [Kiritimatiellales bacterium]MCF7863855.1 glycerol-3-phosphate acyltransferase [Kiritimatiellales bacterium]